MTAITSIIVVCVVMVYVINVHNRDSLFHLKVGIILYVSVTTVLLLGNE